MSITLLSLVKRCFEFSEVACIRRFHRPELEEMSHFQHDDYYDDEEHSVQSDLESLKETLCLEFRFGTHRPKSQICDSGFTLLLLRWTLHHDDKTKIE